MASKVETMLVCDGCGSQDDNEAVEVQTYTLTTGRKTRTFEACGTCLPPATVDTLMEAGRTS